MMIKIGSPSKLVALVGLLFALFVVAFMGLYLGGQARFMTDEEWLGMMMTGISNEREVQEIYDSLVSDGYVVNDVGMKPQGLEMRLSHHESRSLSVIIRFKFTNPDQALPWLVVKIGPDGAKELWRR